MATQTRQTPRWYAEKEKVSEGKERYPLEMPILSLQERDRRWALLREKMYLRGLECLILTGATNGIANIRYVTGLSPAVGAFAIFPLVGDPIGYYGNPHEHVPFGGATQVPGQWLDDIRPNVGLPGVIAGLKERDLGKHRVGVVGHLVPGMPTSNIAAGMLDALGRALPEAMITDQSALVEEMRIIKSEEELEFLRRAGKIARQRVERLMEASKPGATEADAWAAMLHEQIVRGGEPDPFNLFSSGPVTGAEANGRVQALIHGSYPPYAPSQRKLGEGDLLISEFHTTYGGYMTATEFSVFIGQAPKELKRIHSVAGEIVRMARELFVPERTMREVYGAFHTHAEAAGLDFVELGFHGHGLAGLEFVLPVYREADMAPWPGVGDLRLRENMVFGLNVDLHDPAWRRDVGVMLGDTVVVKPGGAEYLCDTPLDLFEVEAK